MTSTNHTQAARDVGADTLARAARYMADAGGYGSSGMLQRKLGVGFDEAARLMTALECARVITMHDGGGHDLVILDPDTADATARDWRDHATTPGATDDGEPMADWLLRVARGE